MNNGSDIEKKKTKDIGETTQFAANLNALLAVYKKSAKQLSIESGTKESTISEYRNGKRMPTLDFMLYLKRKYKISIDDFLSRNITPADYESDPESNTKDIEKTERADYEKYVGLFYLYYFDTSNYKGNDQNSPSEAIMYGLLYIYATPSSLDRLKHNAICIMGITNRQDAVDTRIDLEKAIKNSQSKEGEIPDNDTKIENYIEKKYSKQAYYGDFEMNTHHAFISLAHKNKDRALIILHRTPINHNHYNCGIGTINSTEQESFEYNTNEGQGAIGTINSISRGRESMPTIQFIGLSRKETGLSDDELHRMLLLNNATINNSSATDNLVSEIRRIYTEDKGARSDFQRDIAVKGEISNYVRETIEANLFRVGKVSNLDDDTWYHNLKPLFLKNKE